MYFGHKQLLNMLIPSFSVWRLVSSMSVVPFDLQFPTHASRLRTNFPRNYQPSNLMADQLKMLVFCGLRSHLISSSILPRLRKQNIRPMAPDMFHSCSLSYRYIIFLLKLSGDKTFGTMSLDSPSGACGRFNHK